MSGDQLDLDAIAEKANIPGHVTFPAGAELLALVAEVRRLRAAEAWWRATEETLRIATERIVGYEAEVARLHAATERMRRTLARMDERGEP